MYSTSISYLAASMLSLPRRPASHPVVPLATSPSRSTPRRPARHPVVPLATPPPCAVPRRPARCPVSRPPAAACRTQRTPLPVTLESGTVVVPNRIVTGSSSAVGAPFVARRSQTDEADILLLKEVAARKAHIPVFGRPIAIFLPLIKPIQFCRTRL
jgi:hypothetical protein